MRIGIDIDDTIVNTSEMCINYVKKLDKKYGENIKDIITDNIKNPVVTLFYDNYLYDVIAHAKLKEDAVKVINELYRDNEIYFITARSERFIKDVDNMTKNLLDSYNIKYNKIITGAGKKAELCVENNIDLLIDDSIKHCTNLSNIGIDTLLFNSINNKDIETNLKRVYNWNEVYDYVNLHKSS
ncbi:MAG: hypothetical protein MRZ34_00780 [Bacillales bacterium]|nr:hypothetical protein [Bacillales bacterium]